MPERERFEKLAGCCWRGAVAAGILGLLMVLGSVALRLWGLPAGLAVLGAGLAVAGWLVWLRLKAYGISAAEFLTTRGRAGSHTHPLVLILAGLVFLLPGLYTMLTAAEPADRQPNEISAIEKTWFGAALLLMGLAVCGLGLSGWWSRVSVARRIARLSDEIRDGILGGPDRADRYFDRGLLLARRGEFPRAVEDFSEVIRLAPDRVDGYIERAAVYFDGRDYELAIADYSAALELDRKNPEIYLGRASAHAFCGESEKAEADFLKARELGLKQVD